MREDAKSALIEAVDETLVGRAGDDDEHAAMTAQAAATFGADWGLWIDARSGQRR